MRWLIALVLCISVLLCGCVGNNNPIDNAISLRDKIQHSDGCNFTAQIHADYGDKVYIFSMDCTFDKDGNMVFKVIKPDSISGISGKVSSQGGAITFDDKLLAFQTLAEGEITPVAAPWIFIKTLRSGYIKACTDGDGDYQIEIDDTYDENSLRLNIFVENGLPVNGEIFWKGRRAMTIAIENFNLL